MSSRVEALLPADRHGTWLVTTENGTKTYFDFDDALWMRLPAPRADGTTNRLEHDLRWNRLGLSPVSCRRGEPDRWLGIRVGWSVHYGIGLRDDIYSTTVTSIRQPGDDEAPPPTTPVARFRDPAEVPDWARQPGDAMTAWEIVGGWDLPGKEVSGPTRESVLRTFADEVDRWLSDRVERGEDSRTLRAWLARLDEERSVLTWLRENVVVEED